MPRKLERWLATYLYLYLYETRFKNIKENILHCAFANWNVWYLLVGYSPLETTHTGKVQVTYH